MKKLIIAIGSNIGQETKESISDFRAIIKLIENGDEQMAFSQWLFDEIEKKGKDGWWKPMCLFRSYNLRREIPDKEFSNRIRAEIRAVIDATTPFKGGALNTAVNKAIFENWIQENEQLIQEALKKNSEILSFRNL